MYLQKYRNIGIFHEHVTNKILDDFKSACKPRKLEVFGIFNARGGISTTVESKWPEYFILLLNIFVKFLDVIV